VRDFVLQVPMRVELVVDGLEDLLGRRSPSGSQWSKWHDPLTPVPPRPLIPTTRLSQESAWYDALTRGAPPALITASVACAGGGEREVGRLTLLDLFLGRLDGGSVLTVQGVPPVTLRLTYGEALWDELVVTDWVREWRLHLDPARLGASVGEVRARFVDASGQPVEGGRALLHTPGGAMLGAARLADGTQRFPLVAPGTYLLTFGPGSARGRALGFPMVVEETGSGRDVAGPLPVSVAPGVLVDLGDVATSAARVLRARLTGLDPDEPRRPVLELALVVRQPVQRLVPWRLVGVAPSELARIADLPGGELAVRASIAPDPGYGLFDARGSSLMTPAPRSGYASEWLLIDAGPLPGEVLLELVPTAPVLLRDGDTAGGPREWVLRDALGFVAAAGRLANGEIEACHLTPGRYALEAVRADGGLERQTVLVDEQGATVQLGDR
jgi:hypothetical protein